MVRMHHFSVSPQVYYQLGTSNIFPDIDECPQRGCGSGKRLRRHGFYRRWVITPEGKYHVPIQRYYCSRCRRTVSMLPTFAAPYWQFSLGVVVWILQALYQLGLSTHGVVRQWQRLKCRPELNRQWIQQMRRRLKQHGRPSALLMGIGEEDLPNLESILLKNLSLLHGIEGFSRAYFKSWKQPLLCRI